MIVRAVPPKAPEGTKLFSITANDDVASGAVLFAEEAGSLKECC